MIDALRRTWLFADLDEDALASIAKLAQPVEVARQRLIVQQGEQGGALYLILEGLVKICAYTPEGREIVFALLGKGAFFGEMALLDGRPRSASVYALEDTKLARIRREDFQRLLLDRPVVALRLLEALSDRLRAANRRLAEIGSLDAAHRVYAWLVEHARRFGTALPDGRICVRLPPHQLIADQISTSRETVSRVLAQLKRHGIIERARKAREHCVDVRQLSSMIDAVQ